MIVIFKEMLRDAIEFYADDVVVKSWKRIGHLEHLRVVFDKLCQHQLEMNLLKCAFRATSRKFLWFVVHHWGIKVDFTKKDDHKASTSEKYPGAQGISGSYCLHPKVHIGGANPSSDL